MWLAPGSKPSFASVNFDGHCSTVSAKQDLGDAEHRRGHARQRRGLSIVTSVKKYPQHVPQNEVEPQIWHCHKSIHGIWKACEGIELINSHPLGCKESLFKQFQAAIRVRFNLTESIRNASMTSILGTPEVSSDSTERSSFSSTDGSYIRRTHSSFQMHFKRFQESKFRRFDILSIFINLHQSSTCFNVFEIYSATLPQSGTLWLGHGICPACSAATLHSWFQVATSQIADWPQYWRNAPKCTKERSMFCLPEIQLG